MNEITTYDGSNDIIEVKLDKAIENFLERRGYEQYDVEKVEIEEGQEVEFIKIQHISYDRSKSETDLNLIDFQQLLSATASKSQKFVYMIDSSPDGVDLFIGTTKEFNNASFLKDTFEGIYSGSTLKSGKEYQPQPSKSMKHSKAMMGIPALKRDSDKEYKQSLEKILFPMQGKKFRIVIVAESYNLETIQEIISNYQKLGSELHRLVKQSRNEQISKADSKGVTLTEGMSESDTVGSSETNSDSYGYSDKNNNNKLKTTLVTALSAGAGFIAGGPLGAGIGAGVGNMISNNFYSGTQNENHSDTTATTYSRTNTTNQSQSINQNLTQTNTIGITYDEINKSAEYCENLIDTYIQRFQKGLNHGMWNCSLYIQAEEEAVLSELEHTLKSVYSGDETYYETIRFSDDLSKNNQLNLDKLPMLYFDRRISHPIHPSFIGFSSAVNTEELSILSALPSNDVDGISVSKISSFGLTQPQSNKQNSIDIGTVLNRKKPTKQKFRLSTEALNSHLFVSGITGSGKTNTITSILNKIWKEHKIPFLIIEPAKSEYQYLKQHIPELQIFQPGRANDIFRFNPFVFEYKKGAKYNVLNHIDAVKSSFSAAFPMYGPMPYILEEAIQKIYEKKGWNLLTLEHPAYDEEEGFDNEFNRMLYPTMQDLLEAIEEVVDTAGYHNELQSNIKAALITRIKNLTIGSKGFVFNSQHAIESSILFERPTVIELSSIVNSEEKSFMMGLILNALYRYRDAYGSSDYLKHIVVIEEAHRLLPNISLEQNMESANAQAASVETFVNILAEVRSFGEGIIIADQVANKLHSDVIKNTGIKIIHRTMAKDDRQVVGEAINLTDEQILDIAELKTGEAIVHSQDVLQAFLVRIEKMDIKKDTKSGVDNFQKEFLSQKPYYRYEYPFENRYYDAYSKKLTKENYALIQDKKSHHLILNIVTQALLGKTEKVHFYWQSFLHFLEENMITKHTDIYFAVTIFRQLQPLNQLSSYRKPYYYKKMLESFVELFISLSSNKEISKQIEKVQKSLKHKRMNNLYASMEYYPKDCVDYSILLPELLTQNDRVLEYLNEMLPTVSSDAKKLASTLSEVSQMLFGEDNYELKYAILAMRYGDKLRDINDLLERITDD